MSRFERFMHLFASVTHMTFWLSGALFFYEGANYIHQAILFVPR